MRRKPFEHSGLQGNGFLIWGISKLNKIIVRAQAVIPGGVTALFPSRRASRHADRSGESHHAWHGQLFPYARSLRNDALLEPQSSQVGRLPAIRQR